MWIFGPAIEIEIFHLLSACADGAGKTRGSSFARLLECGQDAGEGFAIVDVRWPMQSHRAVATEIWPSARRSPSPRPRPFRVSPFDKAGCRP